LLENQFILVKQMSENKLFNSFLSLFASNQARESGESKQSVSSDQISESATTNDVLIVSLLQWHSSSMQWSTYFHRLTYQWTWFYVHMQIVSLLQWQVESWSLQWASRLVSLLQWHSSSMQWSIYFHCLTYQWIWFYVHMQIVSLLQWQAESWSLRWASRLVSLLQWHSSSMQWHIYSHRSIYQWIDLSHVHVQLVSLLQWQVDSQSLRWASRLVSLLQWSFYLT